MLTEERKKEILETEEFYSTLNEEEWEEENYSADYDNWYNSLTLEEARFLENFNEKYMDFKNLTLNERIEIMDQVAEQLIPSEEPITEKSPTR